MKLVSLLAGSALLALSSAATFAAEGEQKAQPPGMDNMMKQVIKQQMDKTCQNQEMLSCLEISESDCKSMMGDMMSQCIEPNMGKMMAMGSMGEEERKAMDQKMQACGDKVSKDNGIDPEKAKKCEPKA